MKKIKHAKGVKLELFANRSVPYRDSEGKKRTRTESVYSFEHYLDGEKDYFGIKRV